MKTSLKRLVVDSATDWLYVGIFEGDKALITHYEQGKNNHSATLMPTVEKLFKEVNLDVIHIDELIVGIGPGSYTGVRIGVVVMKMFAWTLNKPLYTVSSLALLASSFTSNGLVMPSIDARRGNAFLGIYDKEGQQLTLRHAEKHMALKDALNDYPKAHHVTQGEPSLPVILHSNVLVKVDDVHLVAPVYLRQTEAERNLS